jgi:hypothetical protein
MYIYVVGKVQFPANDKSYNGCINGHFTNLDLDLNSICNGAMFKILN